MFVAKEKNRVKILEEELDKQYEEMEKKYNALHDFIIEKNPLLLEEFTKLRIKKAIEQADEELKKVEALN